MSSNANPGMNGMFCRSVLFGVDIQVLSLWEVDSKYNNTEIQELSLPKKTRKLSSGCNHHVSPHRRHRLAVGGGWLRCQLGHREPRRPSQSTLMARLKDRHWSEHGGGRLFQINPPSSAFASWKKRKSPPFQKFQEK